MSIQKKHLCVTWLGQAGLWVSMGGQEIVIDPYLSDSVGELDPHKHRRVPVNERFLERRPDIIVCTHDHLDHTDPQTLKHYLTGRPPVTVLGPPDARGSGCALSAAITIMCCSTVLPNGHRAFCVLPLYRLSTPIRMPLASC